MKLSRIRSAGAVLLAGIIAGAATPARADNRPPTGATEPPTLSAALSKPDRPRGYPGDAATQASGAWALESTEVAALALLGTGGVLAFVFIDTQSQSGNGGSQLPSDYETTEYRLQRGLGLINASSAYARGYTGNGKIIAIIDTGLDTSHSEFAGKIAPGGRDYVDGPVPMTDPNGHGTHVAGIAAAARDGVGMHGVAFNARVLPIRIFGPSGSGSLGDTLLTNVFGTARTNGAHVYNNSWGTGTAITATTKASLDATFPAFLAEAQTAVDAGRIIVFANGNESRTEPDIFAGLPHFYPGLNGLWVAVNSVDPNGVQAAYSNKCGVAAAWCITAPGGGDFAGTGIISAAAGGGYSEKSGTSMATPQVSGALAVILEMFQGLTPAEARTRIFVSANKTGAYANTAIYGNGLLDLEAATRPIGTIFVVMGSTLDGAAVPLTSTQISLGSAFGDALQAGFADRSLVVFDSYDAPFQVDLAAFAPAPDSRFDLAALMGRFGQAPRRQSLTFGASTISAAISGPPETGLDTAPSGQKPGDRLGELSFTRRFGAASEISLNYNVDPGRTFGLHGDGTVSQPEMISAGAFAAPYLDFVRTGYGMVASMGERERGGALRIGSFYSENDQGEAFGATAEISLLLRKFAAVNVQTGLLSERGTFLGSHTEGAFAVRSVVPTWFGGVSGSAGLGGGWTLAGSMFAGVSRPEAAPDSLISGFSPIVTRSFSVGLLGPAGARDGDRLGIIVHQPLLVSRGHADIRLTSGRDMERRVQGEYLPVALAPSGREIDLETFYTLALAPRTKLSASATLRLQPGHVENAPPEGVLALRFRRAL